MRLTIFGGTGRTGGHLVWKALARSHQVVVFARTPEKLALQHRQLFTIQGDVRDAASVALAIKGSQGVISAIGAIPGSPEDLMEAAAKNIISGLHANGVKRLIWPASTGIRVPDDDPTIMHQTIEFFLKHLSGKMLANIKRGSEVVQTSCLDWTIARAPLLTDDPRTNAYRISTVGPELGRTLSRENFAEFMLDLVECDNWVHDLPAASDG